MGCFENEINTDKYIDIDDYLSIYINSINDLPININDIYKLLSIENNKYFYKLIENLNKTEPDENFFIDSMILNQFFKFYLNQNDIADIIDSYFQGNTYVINIYKTYSQIITQTITTYKPCVWDNDNGFTINMNKNLETYNDQKISMISKSCSIIISSRGNF